MKTIALVLFLAMSGAAAAGYQEAAGALKVESSSAAIKELDTLLARPGAALAQDTRAAALLADNQAAMELFRQVAEAPSDGYLLWPKPEKLNAATPLPKYAPHIKLLKLLLIDAKVKAERKQTGPAEKDLLAAAGFLVQLSVQKSAVLLSSLVEPLCLQKALPILSDSLRNPSVSPAYLKELASRLDKIIGNQDSMRSAMLEETETSKGSFRDALNPAMMAEELKKVPFWKRAVVRKLQDEEFYSMAYGQYDAARDAHARVMIGVFSANNTASAEAFSKQLQEDLLARKQARDKRGQLAQFIDGLRGGAETKKLMAEALVDVMLNIATPSYEKLVPRYHVFLCELGVLRSVVAVKLYQRARRRLPDDLGQLVPAQLGAVPQDSFNKFAPLVYVRAGKKFLVYSFGPDGRDDKGSAMDLEAYMENPARNAGDIVFAE
jgi:hypothetical protein